MIVAYVASITVLPALLYVFHPPGEPEGLGFAWLAPSMPSWKTIGAHHHGNLRACHRWFAAVVFSPFRLQPDESA